MSIYLDYLNGEGALQHHGVLGMKWGIRRYQPYPKGRVGGKEVGDAARSRSYNRELKKLKRLKDRANVDLQKANAEKYAARAKKAARVGTTAAGIAVGASIARSPLERKIKSLRTQRQQLMDNWDSEYSKITTQTWDNIMSTWDKKTRTYDDALYSKYADEGLSKIDKLNADLDKNFDAVRKKADFMFILNKARKFVTYGAAATAGVAGGVYAYNKVQEKLARKRVTEIGHAKAEEAVKKQTEKMLEMFGDIKIEEISK